MNESRKRFGPDGIAFAICVLFGIGFVVMLLPGSGDAPEAFQLSECRNNLFQLGMALHNYHDTHKAFPPAIVRDETGRPHLSWRTLVLPFVDQADLYGRYKLEEAWDSPHNKSVLPGPIEVFRCPANRTAVWPPTTNYVAVIGPNTVWHSDGSVVSAKDITDGLSNTILLVETKEAGIHYFEPRDLSLDQMMLTINPQVGQGVSSDNRRKNRSLGTHVLMADLKVKRLPDDLPADVFYALFTINGGERVIEDDKGWRLDR